MSTNEGFNRLPQICYFLEDDGLPGREVMALRRGESGWYEVTIAPKTDDQRILRGWVDSRNAALEVTPAQVAAMVHGSMFDWASPLADPENYDEMGKLRKGRLIGDG